MGKSIKNNRWILLLCIAVIACAFTIAGCGAGNQAEQTDNQAEQTEAQTAPADQAGLKDGTYEIRINGDEDNEAAAQLLALMNQYRTEHGLSALEWNDEPAEELRVRAAELAINFSDTRLDGTPGKEMLRGHYDSIEEGAGQILKDDEFTRLLADPENTSFCAGVFQSYSGPAYVAAGIYAKAGVKDAPPAGSKERTFTLVTTDDALNCHGQLMDQEMEPEDPNSLYEGEGYYYCIINENQNFGTVEDVGDNEEELEGVYAASSNPEVVTIDAHGDVTARKAGTATLTVRPAEDSAIEFVQHVTVQ